MRRLDSISLFFAVGALALSCGGKTVVPDTDGVALLKIGGKPNLPDPPSSSRPARAPAAPAAPVAPGAPAAAQRLPPPEGQPPYALGFSHAVDGCLHGYAYSRPPGSHDLPDDYADAPPGSEVWGCEWSVANAGLATALPGAKAGEAFAVRYQGTFQVGASGVFHFGTASSSALRFSVDGTLVSEHGGATAGTSDDQAIYLGAGRHQVVIEYLAAGATITLNIAVTAPGGTPTPFSMRPSSPFYSEQGLDYTGPAGGVGQSWRQMVAVDAEAIELKGRILFQSASAELNQKDESEASLLAVAKTLKEHPKVRCVEVQGHTDTRGDADYNLRLSRARAEAVRSWLVAAGIEPHRLTTRGFGGSQALGSNDTEAGRAANRRVEFVIHAPNADGSCPRGDAASGPVVRERPAAPELAERACKKSAEVRGELARELAPWLGEHQLCSTDADCTQAVPLDCAGKSKALDCAWALVSQRSVEDLRVFGARLDSLKNFCGELPEDHLVRSCGGCAARALSCNAGKCTLAR